MSAVRKVVTSALRPCALLVAVLLGASPAPAVPVSVSDAGDGRLHIEAHDASIGEVLAALQEAHLIEFSTADPLSRTLTGTYTGALPQVLSRILDGYNYFLHVTASGTELHIINVASRDYDAMFRPTVSSNADAAAAPAPAVSSPAPRPPAANPQTTMLLSPDAAKARARRRAQQPAKTP